MRYLSICFLLFASTAFAQGVRFTGSGVGDTNNNGIYDYDLEENRYDVGASVTFEGEYASDITLPLYHPTWDFDITTDGQSVTIHDMTVSYHNDALYINPLVWLELSVEAKIEDVTVDINPSTTTVWTVQGHPFSSMSVSGVYHGLGLTQAFEGTLPRYIHSSTNNEEALLDFVNWPDELAWEAGSFPLTIDGTSVDISKESRIFSASSSDGWIGVEPYLHIREIQVYEPVSVLLSPIVESADFNQDSDVDGADFLTWQRNVESTIAATHTLNAIQAEGDANGDGVVNGDDLTVWQEQFGTTPLAISTIPEPSTILLAMLGLASACCYRRSRV
jgi:hypothetical protein